MTDLEKRMLEAILEARDTLSMGYDDDDGPYDTAYRVLDDFLSTLDNEFVVL